MKYNRFSASSINSLIGLPNLRCLIGPLLIDPSLQVTIRFGVLDHVIVIVVTSSRIRHLSTQHWLHTPFVFVTEGGFREPVLSKMMASHVMLRLSYDVSHRFHSPRFRRKNVLLFSLYLSLDIPRAPAPLTKMFVGIPNQDKSVRRVCIQYEIGIRPVDLFRDSIPRAARDKNRGAVVNRYISYL